MFAADQEKRPGKDVWTMSGGLREHCFGGCGGSWPFGKFGNDLLSGDQTWQWEITISDRSTIHTQFSMAMFDCQMVTADVPFDPYGSAGFIITYNYQMLFPGKWRSIYIIYIYILVYPNSWPFQWETWSLDLGPYLHHACGFWSFGWQAWCRSFAHLRRCPFTEDSFAVGLTTRIPLLWTTTAWCVEILLPLTQLAWHVYNILYI